MKLGDQKQAIALGVVALFAIGFLAKTAFGAFGGQGSKPIVVQELRGGPARSQPVASATNSPATPPTQNEPVKAPEKNAAPNLAVRDAFAKFATQTDGKPKAAMRPVPNQGFWPQESQVSNSDRGPETVPPANPMANAIGNDPPTGAETSVTGKDSPKGGSSQTSVEKKDPITVRFDGYVNAGTPMAVLTYKGASYTVTVGEVLSDGVKVLGFTSEKITLSKGKSVKTIFVGRETEF